MLLTLTALTAIALAAKPMPRRASVKVNELLPDKLA